MAANNVLRVSDLNYDSIKQNLKTFLSSQSDFTDHDFDGSDLSIILGLLAYNTYLNSFYHNMAINETFLDSGQLRNNIVSRAKMLDYTPTSARGATATLNLTIVPDDSPASVTVDKNTVFISTIDGISYKFVTPQAYVINAASNTYSTTISITEGEPLTHKFTVSTGQRYIIPNKNVDTSSLKITVQASSSNSSSNTYTQASDLFSVNGNSSVYFLQENENQRYEVVFGDGVLGKQLRTGNIVIIDYRVCNGTDGNGANNFTGASTVGGYSTYSFTLASRASGGANQESIDSIKFSAPKHYETQNRAVTAEDYKRIILNNNPDIQAISVWGGEENNPPIYGKVYITAKPTGGSILSDERKQILKTFLKKYSVMSIDAEVIDPVYLFIVPTVEIRYDPKLTTLSASEISTLVQSKISSFETNNLGNLKKKFYYSKFVKALDGAENSIVTTSVKLNVHKKFIPNTTSNVTYKLNFNNQLVGITTSSTFTFNGKSNCRFDCDGAGKIRIYYLSDGKKVFVSQNAGTINYKTGLVTLTALKIQSYSGDHLYISAEPYHQNISTVRNQIPLISDTKINVYNEDTNTLESTVSNVTTEGETLVVTETGINTLTI